MFSRRRHSWDKRRGVAKSRARKTRRPKRQVTNPFMGRELDPFSPAKHLHVQSSHVDVQNIPSLFSPAQRRLWRLFCRMSPFELWHRGTLQVPSPPIPADRRRHIVHSVQGFHLLCVRSPLMQPPFPRPCSPRLARTRQPPPPPPPPHHLHPASSFCAHHPAAPRRARALMHARESRPSPPKGR